jgi:hypothetical protein
VKGWLIIRRGEKQRPSPSFWNSEHGAWLPIGGTVYPTEAAANEILTERFIDFATAILSDGTAEIDVWPAQQVIGMYGRIS